MTKCSNSRRSSSIQSAVTTTTIVNSLNNIRKELSMDVACADALPEIIFLLTFKLSLGTERLRESKVPKRILLKQPRKTTCQPGMSKCTKKISTILSITSCSRTVLNKTLRSPKRKRLRKTKMVRVGRENQAAKSEVLAIWQTRLFLNQVKLEANHHREAN